MAVATWSRRPGGADDVTARVRASLETDIATTRSEFMALMEPGELDTEPAATAAGLAFAALQAAWQAAPEYRRCALAMMGQTEEAEAEARRAYATEQNRRWFRANPNGADAVAAAMKAADAARERTAQYLLATRLEQLREQAATETAAASQWGTGCASAPYGLAGAPASASACGGRGCSSPARGRRPVPGVRGRRRSARWSCDHRSGRAAIEGPGRRDGREPLGLGTAITMMMTERGMVAPAAAGGVLARFDDILAAAAPELTGPACAVAFDVDTGRLDVVPDAPSCGTKLRSSAPKLIAAANTKGARICTATKPGPTSDGRTCPVSAVSAGSGDVAAVDPAVDGVWGAVAEYVPDVIPAVAGPVNGIVVPVQVHARVGLDDHIAAGCVALPDRASE
ncbi:hypothetical protein [Streptomyces yatensis]|uniref:Uncharacterized protein n=1 Tax=Streptomyces yatensis TaxID=155177 RepID=A0ABN2IQ72_9ACTN|nr:hypothetical protein [Streptomyces yatensis]